MLKEAQEIESRAQLEGLALAVWKDTFCTLGRRCGHSVSGGQDWECFSQFPSIPVKERMGLSVGRKRLVTKGKTWAVRV